MKTRLFWKILLAFWLTFFAITQGVWLLFELNRNDGPPPERFMAELMAPVLLSAAEKAVEEKGGDGFHGLVRTLPAEQRIRLQLTPKEETARPPAPDFTRFIGRTVTAPGQQQFEIEYWYRQQSRPTNIFNMPWEMLTLGLIGGLFFSAVLAWYLTRPITRLRRGFVRLAQGHFSERLAPIMGNRRDEIADLARDFDLMAQRLEQLVRARERLLHDVSHELRSPLARLQLAIALARQSPARIDASLDRIDREAARLDTLVGELLTLARAEHLANGGEEYFDLAGVLRSVTDDARFEAKASGVTIALDEDIPPDHRRPPVRGHAEMVRRAIDNVIRNAMRFSAEEQRVRVAISHDADQHFYRIEVTDAGPGVSEEEISSMFDPFIRGQNAGSGFGLGLTIASRAIAVHHGSIEARRGEASGLTISMTIPCIAENRE